MRSGWKTSFLALPAPLQAQCEKLEHTLADWKEKHTRSRARLAKLNEKAARNVLHALAEKTKKRTWQVAKEEISAAFNPKSGWEALMQKHADEEQAFILKYSKHCQELYAVLASKENFHTKTLQMFNTFKTDFPDVAFSVNNEETLAVLHHWADATFTQTASSKEHRERHKLDKKKKQEEAFAEAEAKFRGLSTEELQVRAILEAARVFQQ